MLEDIVTKNYVKM